MKNNLVTKIKFKKTKIGLATILFITSWFSFEALRNRVSFVIISILYVIWLTNSVLKSKQFLYRMVKLLPLIIWIFLIFIRTIVGMRELTSELTNGVTFIMIFSIFEFYRDYDMQYKKAILYIILISYAITGVITLYYLNIDPNIVRRSAAGLLTGEFYIRTYGSNVLMSGSWDYIYSLVGTSIILMNIANNSKSKFSRRIFLSIAVLFVLVILKASLSTAILCLFMLVIINLLPKKKDTKVLFYFLVMIIFVSIIPVFGSLLEGSLKYIDNPNYAYKIEQAVSLIRGDLSFSVFYPRYELMKKSITVFLENPILGVYGINKFEYFNVSGHSQWVDDLARYGVISQLFFYFGMYRIITRLLSYSENINYRKNLKIQLIYMFVFGLINPAMLIHLYLMLFLITPFSSSID